MIQSERLLSMPASRPMGPADMVEYGPIYFRSGVLYQLLYFKATWDPRWNHTEIRVPSYEDRNSG